MNRSNVYVGLMSGTSLDGVDAVVADLSGTRPSLRGKAYLPYPMELRAHLLELCTTGTDELHRAALTANQLAEIYANAATAALADADVSTADVVAVGCHGQTLRHRPDLRYTTQIGNAAVLAERLGVAVVSDFRSRDIAAGGQGAPLVPAFHAAVFSDPTKHRVIVNVGGIANLTNLPPTGEVTGFDCGPGNFLMDLWAQRHLGTSFDDGGSWAASGTAIPSLLARLSGHPFFARRPPKSAGREDFRLPWMTEMLHGEESPADVQATLLALTIHGIAEGVRAHCLGAEELLVCGGGAHNLTLLEGLQDAMTDCRVDTTSALGIDPDWVEAIAFAWLARQTMENRPGNVPAVTGARHPCVLGAIHPA